MGIGGGSKVCTLGSIDIVITVDGLNLPIKFHIDKKDINYQAIIGSSVLDEVNIMVTKEATKFGKRRVKLEEDNVKEKNIWQEWETLCLSAELKEFVHQDVFDVTHLSDKHAREVSKILREYNPKKNRIAPIQMKLILTDEIPVAQRPRRLSYECQQEVEKQIKQWLDEGIVRPSMSEFASPIVLVKKKDGSTRLCCDFRKLNKKVVRDNFPMALIDDVIERLRGAKVFTTLDLTNGYFHVPIEENSKKYTSLVTHNGQYEFNFVPFGISNSPAVFTRYMMAVLRDFIQNRTIQVYMDDIIIPTKDEDEGILKLKEVLKQAQEYGLQIKWKKCQILKRRVEFLGYIIEDGTIKPSEDKTNAIKNFPIPKNKKALQRFLGLTSYFRRFIENYAIIAKPMSDMLRNSIDFKMNDEATAAFQQLKIVMINPPLLQIFDPKAETEVHTDACKFGYGAILMQKNSEDQKFHPVQYMSRKTKPAEEKYHSYELEVLAIVEAFKKWRTYVLGMKVKIITDCNAFRMTMQKEDLPARITRWAMFLQDFHYEIEHRPGSKMQHVDALSRVSCLVLAEPLRHRLKEAQLKDDYVKIIRIILEKGPYKDFYLSSDILFKDPNKELIVVPEMMEEEIIKIAHKQGHFSATKTQELVEIKELYVSYKEK